ncbi:MAG: PDZ domain-containing protein [Desulfobacterales bacterium]|nr:PDZ domain-containing protein [Desulfobacterales bacterium]
MNALFTLANLILLGAASWMGVGLFYQAATANLEQRTDTVVFRKADIAAQRLPSKPLAAYSVIELRNLFNSGTESEKKAPEKDLDIEALNETKLDLRLWGTVVFGSDAGDYAVIEDKKTRKQELYRVGDPIQNAVVKAILREKVVLNVSGKDEILTMEETPGVQLSSARTVPGAAPEPFQRQMTIERAAVEEAMNNIGELMKQVRIRPYFENGLPAGLSLTGVRPDSIFQKMGIRSGDVLLAVDGEQIRSVDDVVNLYEKIGASDGVALQIKRRGQTQDLDFQIR